MSLLQALFGSKKPASAAVAKDRLQLIIARERSGSGAAADFLPKLQQELLQVIAKYVKVDPDSVKVEMDHRENLELLAINITLPEQADSAR